MDCKSGDYANRDAVPAMFVALDNEEPVGSASLVSHDLPDRDDLSHLRPWLSGVYVVRERRGRGVARALVGRVERAATRLGCGRLYLYTQTARGLYERLGWEQIGELTTQGRPADHMSKSLRPGLGSLLLIVGDLLQDRGGGAEYLLKSLAD